MCKEHCGGAHPAYECRKKSTAARKDVPFEGQSKGVSDEPVTTGQTASSLERSRATQEAGTQALPVDTNACNLLERVRELLEYDSASGDNRHEGLQGHEATRVQSEEEEWVRLASRLKKVRNSPHLLISISRRLDLSLKPRRSREG
jgi:hypothetical protein